MVQNTIKAETIEKAVQTALNILQCFIEKVEVQVVPSSSNSLFSLRKGLAEVSITRRVLATVLQDKNDDEQLNGLIEEVYISNIPEVKRPKQLLRLISKIILLSIANER